MIYPALIPPFEFESYETLTKKQAQQLFDWYISCIPQRVELLEECFNGVWGCGIHFDYSLESLDPLWEAFEKHMKIEKKSIKQVMEEHKGFPIHVMKEILKDRRDLSKGTYVTALDIAMYFGEVLARHLPGVHWGYFTKPKKLASVNQPVLLGFGNDYMDPAQTVLVGCYRSIEGPNPRYLSHIVDVWRRFLPCEAAGDTGGESNKLAGSEGCQNSL